MQLATVLMIVIVHVSFHFCKQYLYKYGRLVLQYILTSRKAGNLSAKTKEAQGKPY